MSASRSRVNTGAGNVKRLPIPANDDWIHLSDKGAPVPNLSNVLHALRFRPELRGLLAYDEMSRVTVLTGPIPGNAAPPPDKPRPLQDVDVSALQERLQHMGLDRVARETVFQAVEQRATECAFHPVRDYLNGLSWDGKPRVATWLSRYLGTDRTSYTEAIGQMSLVAMAARIFQPGSKCDYLLVLEGDQGDSKSSACGILGGAWFSDNLPPVHTDPVRTSMHLRGKWLLEIAEMHAMGKAESAELKAFITRSVEMFTPKYARLEVSEPRQCVFIGTTNKAEYLRDETGGRRFWPVRVGTIDLEALTRDRDQLFAEAVALYRAGQRWWPERDFEAEHIKPEQDKRFEADAWEDTIAAFLRGKRDEPAMVAEIAKEALFITTDKLGTADQRRIGAVLARLEWGKGKRGPNGERYFYPPGHPKRDDAQGV